MRFLKDFSLAKYLDNKKFMFALSVIVAFIFWLVITVDQTPVREATVNVTVNISVDGTIVGDMGMDVISGGIGQKVDVRVSGPSYIVSDLNSDDIYVSPSLSDVTEPGIYTLSLTPSRASSKAGYEFVSVTPSVLSVRFDYVDTKEFTLVTEAKGAVASEGLIAEAATVTDSSNSTITVKGPRTEMSKIASVMASVDVNRTLSKTESFDADVMLLDADGKEIDSSAFTLSSEKVKISVPISKKKTVEVKATFTNAPSSIGNSLSYTLSQNTVTVIGPPETIDSLEYVELSPVDFQKVSTAAKSFEVTAILPDGVRILDNIEFVTVNISLKNYGEKIFTVSNYQYINLPVGLTASVTEPIKNVKICGPSNIIYKLNNNNFYAQVDLSGKSAGEYTVAVKVFSSTSGDVWQVGSYTAVVKIQAQ